MSHVHYVAFYADKENKNKYSIYPAAITKINYIKSVLKRSGFKIEVFALGLNINKRFSFFKKRSKVIDSNESITFVSTITGPTIFMKFVSKIWLLFQLLWHLIMVVKKEDTVIFYHSYSFMFIVRISRLFNRFRLIYEVEEIYQAAWGNSDKMIKKEILYISKIADGYIFVNDIMPFKFKLVNKPFVVCYGSYEISNNKIKKIKSAEEGINLIYAGVIEDEGSDVYLALNSIRYLQENYRLHILGYGEEYHLKKLVKRISEMNLALKKERVFYHGFLSGQEYLDFLSRCDIGLSTRVLDDKFSDFTFPSKVLVYLTNHLFTVSSNITCIRESKVSELIYFYDEATPASVAKTIQEISLNKPFPVNKIAKLDESFRMNLVELLN